MKVIAYVALHYGADFLAHAIRSVIDHIDELHVLYSATGSHGHHTDRVCPDSRDTLYAIAQSAAGDKLRWHDGSWIHEGYQRDSIHDYAPDADVILVLDADEVWADGLAQEVIAVAQQEHKPHTLRVPFIHYWRSFRRAFPHDPAYPTRAIFRGGEGDATLGTHRRINHFGYAQSSVIIEYKQHTHGHKGEWRRDVDWFTDVFMANRQFDCHPVGSEYWNAELVNPLDYMPAWMSEHPYFNLKVIP